MNWKNIEISAKPLFDKYLGKFPSYSDFNLLSLLSWDATGVYRYDILNENLVIRIKDYLGDGFLYSILGENNLEKSVTDLIEEVGKLSFVPEIVVNKLDSSKFTMEPERDSFDYIVSTEGVSKLEGPEFRHLRQDVASFHRSFPHYFVKVLDLKDPQTLKEVTALSLKWYKDKNFDEQKVAEENAMFSSFLKYSPTFNCLCLGLYVEEKLIAYIFNEILLDRVVMGHFGVSDKDYKLGAYMMEYETAKYLFEKGYLFQNLQQDAGLLGLRAAKLFYNPVEFLKKYTVSRIA